MNPDLTRLQSYPFEKLAGLLEGITEPKDLKPISLSIGEPKHPTPALILDALQGHLAVLSVYPNTRGTPALREAIAQWAERRFRLPAQSLNPETQVLPVNGTREALFSFAQAMVDRTRSPLVLMPNPFYQIYEGAALLAGAQPYFIPCTANMGFLPEFDAVPEQVWQSCQLLYLCSPGNPTGAVIGRSRLRQLMQLADRYDFIIAADECYSEIYFDETNPPPGLLETAAETGNSEFRRCMVFHSLSKRSNAPGLRSGFVAGDPRLIEAFFRYRTYHGCALPLHTQAASVQAWSDEGHVVANRALYREKFNRVLDILGGVLDLTRPEAAFYLWAPTPIPDTEFARRLRQQENVTVLPGRFLSREVGGNDPGANRVRLALVAALEECIEAAERIRRFVATL